MRKLTETKTFKGCQLAFIGSLAAIAVDPIFNIVDNRVPESWKADISQVRILAKAVILLVGGGGAGLGAYGRASVGDVESSSIFPGPNIGDRPSIPRSAQIAFDRTRAATARDAMGLKHGETPEQVGAQAKAELREELASRRASHQTLISDTTRSLTAEEESVSQTSGFII